MNYIFDYKNKLDYYLLCLFSFSLPLWQKFSTITLLVWLLISFFSIKKFKFNKGFSPLLLFYFSYIIFDLIHGKDGLSVMEMKASLLALPLIFSLNQFSFKQLKKGCLFFVYGCLFAIVLCYFFALYKSVQFSEGVFVFHPTPINISDKNGFLNSSLYGGNYFFGNQFSVFHQTVYFSIYLNLALIITLFTDFFKPKFRYFIVLVFSIALFQISNMTNITLFTLIILTYLFNAVNGVYKKISILFFGLTIVLSIVVFNPRVNNTLKKIYLSGINLDREAEDSMGTRLLIWDASIKVVQNHFLLGVGPSNTYDKLKSQYKKSRYIIPFRNRLNCHNQFLQVLIESGLIGFFLLISCIIILLKQNYYRELVLLMAFVFIINFLFESVMNRYSGIIIFAFVYSMLMSIDILDEKK